MLSGTIPKISAARASFEITCEADAYFTEFSFAASNADSRCRKAATACELLFQVGNTQVYWPNGVDEFRRNMHSFVCPAQQPEIFRRRHGRAGTVCSPFMLD